MKGLEQFIENNREAFDEARPPEHLWSQIQAEVAAPKSTSNRESKMIWMVSKIAAAFALVLASGIVIGYYMNANGAGHSKAMDDYYAVEQRYVNDINMKMTALRAHNVDPNVEMDLMQLDEVFDELKMELTNGSNVNKDQLIQALIRNYEVKVDILERVLSRIDVDEDEPIEYKDLRHDSISM